MKVLIFLAATLTAAKAVSLLNVNLAEWNLFKAAYNKTYGSDAEEKFRMKIYMDNKQRIAKHNARYELGEVSFKMGLNKYSDMSHQEFVQTMNGFKSVQTDSSSLNRSTFIYPANIKLPDTVNWVKKGAVTPVKDQGICGSCWAFSSTGGLEGQQYRKSGSLVSLSEQNLVDCSTSQGNNGCDGGLMEFAFRYVQKNHGLDTEESYPYEGMDDKCRYNASESGVNCTGFVDIPSEDEEALKAAVATVGPISVAIDASQPSFQSYAGGVYFEPDCQNTVNNLDHGVLVVGYGTDENDKDYWLVKNSWGKTWGEDGYIRMSRNVDNNCGVATAAIYPLV